jgi:hypothetical protein
VTVQEAVMIEAEIVTEVLARVVVIAVSVNN